MISLTSSPSQNAQLISEAIRQYSSAHLPPGVWQCDPIFINHGRRSQIIGHGCELRPSPAAHGVPFIRIEGTESVGTSLRVWGLSIVNYSNTIPTALIEARRFNGEATNPQGAQRPGTDPGIRFFGCEFIGLASQGIVALRGAELVEFHGCTIAQDRAGAAGVFIENLASTTRYLFNGGQVTNFGGGFCIECFGSVQELCLTHSYLASNAGGILATSKGGENKYLDRVTLMSVRHEGAGPVILEDGGVVRYLDVACLFQEDKEADSAAFWVTTQESDRRIFGVQKFTNTPVLEPPP